MACVFISPELMEEFGGNALTIYCRYLDTPELLVVVRYLCSKHYNLRTCDYYGCNALLAFLENDVFINKHPDLAYEIVQLLIAHGVSAIQCDNFGEDALWKLFVATTNPKTAYPIARLLLAHGADVNLTNPNAKMNTVTHFVTARWELLFQATERPEEEALYLHKLVELFVYYGLNFDTNKSFLNYLLYDRAKSQPIFLDTVKLLIQAGADLNYIDSFMGSALLSCCRFRRTSEAICKLTEYLIVNGANVRHVNERTGENALANFIMSIDSVGADELKVISLLCARGSNVNQKFVLYEDDIEAFDALEFVLKSTNKFLSEEILSISKVLVDHGAQVQGLSDSLMQVVSTYVVRWQTPIETSSSFNEENRDNDYSENANIYEQIETKEKVKLSLNKWLSADSRLSALCKQMCHEIWAHQVCTNPRTHENVDKRMKPARDRHAGFRELLEFLLENGANVNSYEPTTTWSVFHLLLCFYQGKDFIDILRLFCRYKVNVNIKFYKASQKRTMDALDLLLLNEHQENCFNEAVMLLLDHGLHPIQSLDPDYQSLYLEHLAKKQAWPFSNVIKMTSSKCLKS